jgi:hypothetical protein
VYVLAKRIGMAEAGKVPPLRALDMLQASRSNDATGHAEGEDCAQSEAATTDAPRSLLAALGRQAAAGAIRDFFPPGGL